MTRSIHRRSLATRLFSVYVLIVVLVSFTGIGYAVPKGADAAKDAAIEEMADPPDADKEAKAIEESPAETIVEPPVELVEVVVEDAPPAEVSPPQPAETQEPDAAKVAPLPVAPVATVADIGGGDVNLQGVRKGTGWIKGNLHSYMEGDWVPFRLYVRNTSAAPVSIPQLAVDAFHYKAGKGIYFDRTADYLYYTTPTEPAIGDPTVPQGSWSSLSLSSKDVPIGGTYGVSATGLLTTISGGQVTIPAGEYAVLYFRAHLALTYYWNTQSPSRDGWGPYTGSPGNMKIHGDFGEKTVPLPAVEMPAGTVNVVKFYDKDRDGVMDDGEMPLSGWDINLLSSGGVYQWDVTKTTGADGKVVFGKLPGGSFGVSETLKDGWVTSTDQPVAVSLAPGQSTTVYIGNYRPDVTKRFSLTYEGSVPSGIEMLVKYKVDGVGSESMLAGSGPYTAERVFPVGTNITDVEWYARWTPDGGAPVDILLGMTSGEALRDELTVNSFTWGSQIMGHKYEDLDADGVRDSEPGLEGWRIVAERQVGDAWVEMAFRMTDADGFYKFYSLPPGTYRVSEQFPVDGFDWMQSMPVGGYHMITIDPIDCTVAGAACVGPSFRGIDFMNWAPASIEGLKFDDVDGDGVHDAGEPGLPGWLIFVDYDGDDVYDANEPAALTDADGAYLITGIHPGTYAVKELLVGAWVQSYGTFVQQFESRGHYMSERGAYDFGNWLPTSIEGYKFHDLNADGAWGIGEPGLASWTIYVDLDRDGVFDVGEPSDVTDGTGYYLIEGLAPGEYEVREVLQGDWFQSYPGPLGYYTVTLVSGIPASQVDFGNWTTASIEGHKFEDMDANGFWDANEPVLAGWTIFVDYNGNGVLDDDEPFDVTDDAGHYLITDVLPGTFDVLEVMDSGWNQSRGGYYVEFVSAGHYGESGEYDFGNWQPIWIEGYKFEDTNGNGVWDNGEPGLPGWRIILVGDMGGPNGLFLIDTYTDATGHYSFWSLPPAHYLVMEELVDGWTQSYPASEYWDLELGSGQTPERSLDFGNWSPLDPWGYKYHDLDADGVWEDGEPPLEGWVIHLDGTTGMGEPYHRTTATDANGYWEFTEVPPGEYVLSEDLNGWEQSFPGGDGEYEVTFGSGEMFEVGFEFGNWTPAAKEGTKFEDLNANGVRDIEEPGLAGWVIYVDYDGDGEFDADEPFDITGDLGTYEILDILPGTYMVRELMQMGADWTQSMPGAPDFGYLETFDSSDRFAENDFGNWAPAEIHGTKYHDLDADGSRDEGELGLEGWRIFVDYNGNDAYDSGEPTAMTGADGAFHITDIHPGTYEVREVLPGDWMQSQGTYTVEFKSSDVYGRDGGYDFGNWRTGTKEGTKFEDLNANGIYDNGEPGLMGWTIFVDYDGDGMLDQGEPFDITDSQGMYLIEDVIPGTFMVLEVMKSDYPWTQSMPGAPGFGYLETFTSGVSFVGNDFGNWASASIRGVKFHDLDADGFFDQDESGLAGWRIFVDYDDDGIYDIGEPTAVTSQSGTWFINDIIPGEYDVLEVLEDDWFQSRGNFVVEFMSRGEYGAEGEYDFGNYTYASKSGVKFHDKDGDRQAREEGEPGLEGWTFYVDYNQNGQLDEGEPFGVSDEDGAYTIEGILPGTWVVREMMPEELSGDWKLTYPGMGVYIEEFVSQGVYEGNDFGNTTEVPKTFELTYIGGAPEGTTFYASFDTTYTMYSPPPLPIENDDFVTAQAVAIEVASHEVTLSPIGSGMYAADFMVWPQTLLGNVKWWAEYQGERILLGTGIAEELIDGPLTNPFEYGAELFGNKWDDSDLEPILAGDGVWDVDEPGIPDWTIELYRMADEEWELYDTMLTDSEGAYVFDGLLPGSYSVVEVIPVEPVSGFPIWIQSAGPVTVGDGATAISNESAVGPVNFGNFLPPGLRVPDMSLIKDVSRSTASPGDTLTYTLTWEMVKGGVFEGEVFTITDDYDERYMSVVSANGGIVYDGKITWTLLGPVSEGDTGSISYQMAVATDMPAGTTVVDNIAVIDKEGDDNPNNNTDDASVRVGIRVVGDPFLPFTGAEFAYMLAVLVMTLASGAALRFRGRKKAA